MLERPIIGHPVPAIDLIDTTGEPWRLDDHRGHPVVLIFHRHLH